MDADPTVEQFIKEYFNERTIAEKLYLETHRPYWRCWHHDDCLWDRRRHAFERREAERIVNISDSPSGKNVVTTGTSVFRSRYNVKSSGGSWLIHEVDMECAFCRGSGVSAGCNKCGGTGWLSWKDRANWGDLTSWQKPAARTSRSTPEEESEDRPVRDPAIEQFMSDYFRERTLARKKESEILGALASRFCSPEFDWTRWGGSVQGTEAERIVSVAHDDTGAHVITRGPYRWRQRYQLRPVGPSWLIWEVDTECFHCFHQGQSADCFWCGGTIWNRKASEPGSRRPQEPPTNNPRWSP